MHPARSHTSAIVGLWLILVAVSMYSRYYIPIDETRYVTVAWNMWIRDDFLVPFLNNEAYSHKPPLLFWMMHLGWKIFGVNDWWPRLVPSFFALGGIFLTMRIANMLWPSRDSVARMASVILFGSLLWTAYTTATMFDMLVAFFTLLGMLGVLTAWRGDAWKGWGLTGLAIGLGLLAKGPTILLQILPVALLAPWWAKDSKLCWRRWYLSIAGAVLLGAAIALAWAIPAGIRGGAVYQHAIFWGQTADRMVNSFAHQRPFWWYFSLMPAMLFPWLLWGGVWQSMAKLRANLGDTGIRFCIAWALPVFLAFSFISGKQVHYLLPIFPAFTLLLARGLDILETPPGKKAKLGVGIAIILIGVIVLVLPHWAARTAAADWLKHTPILAGMVLLLCGSTYIIWKPMITELQVWLTATTSLIMVLILHLAVLHTAGLAYDVRPISAKLKMLEDAGVPIANLGKYHGQYQFAGRLQHSIEQIEAPQLAAWFNNHPDGRVILYPKMDADTLQGHGKADFLQPYRGGSVGIYSREALMQAN